MEGGNQQGGMEEYFNGSYAMAMGHLSSSWPRVDKLLMQKLQAWSALHALHGAGGREHQDCVVCRDTPMPLLEFRNRVENIRMKFVEKCEKYFKRKKLMGKVFKRDSKKLKLSKKLLIYGSVNTRLFRSMAPLFMVHDGLPDELNESLKFDIVPGNKWVMELICFNINHPSKGDGYESLLLQFDFTSKMEGGKLAITCESTSLGIFIETDLSCSYCVSPLFKGVQLDCGHFFCKTCLKHQLSVSRLKDSIVTERSCTVCNKLINLQGRLRMYELDKVVERHMKESGLQDLIVQSYNDRVAMYRMEKGKKGLKKMAGSIRTDSF